MKKILSGYISLFREMLLIKNDVSFLVIPASLTLTIVICGLIGWIRNALQVGLGTPIFYSFTPDILWTMFFWPIHLFLFPSMILHTLLQWFGHQKINAESVFALAFHLQILHIFVPLFDWLGFAIGLPWMYELGTPAKSTDLYINYLVMTPGIIVVWTITGYMVARVLKKNLEISWPLIITASAITFFFILIPIYFIWPTFNTLFNQIFGILVWDNNDPRLNVPRQIQWGYGTYMALTSLLGLAYFAQQRQKMKWK
jgi:hypothetical protein